jgi:hypothetical protein
MMAAPRQTIGDCSLVLDICENNLAGQYHVQEGTRPQSLAEAQVQAVHQHDS